MYLARLGNLESRSLALSHAYLDSISPAEQLAVTLQDHSTLAQIPLLGGAPREILEDVDDADWAPDGKNLAVVHHPGDQYQLEFPIGKVLYRSSGGIMFPQISPKGDLIAFVEFAEGRKSIDVVDLSGKKRVLFSGFINQNGLAWSAEGNEIWFGSVAPKGSGRSINAVNLSGQHREIARMDGILTIQDISKDGRLLLSHGTQRNGIVYSSIPSGKALDLSWGAKPFLSDISADGEVLLFTDLGESEAEASVYLRKTDGTDAVRLGEGYATGLSPDGEWALSISTARDHLTVLPTGPGKAKLLPNEKHLTYTDVSWFPDGQQVLISGREPGHSDRLYVQDLDDSSLRAISPEEFRFDSPGNPISPDGLLVIARRKADYNFFLFPVRGGEPRPIPELVRGDSPIRWSPDGRFVYFYRHEETTKIHRLDMSTRKKELWKEVILPDPAGVDSGDTFPLVTPDGKSYAYGYIRILSDLYVVEGLK